jgi:transcription initiation factor TFIIF subunit alpha
MNFVCISSSLTLADSPPQSPSTGTGPLQPSDIIAALPSTGITIGDLMKLFSSRVGENNPARTPKSEFIRLVKENSKYGNDKLLRPK